MEILKDYTSFRLDRELSIIEADSEAQKKYKKFFNNKLQQHDVKSPAELDNKGKKKFFSEIKSEWKGASKTQESITNDELVDLLIDSIAEGLLEEPKSLSNITEYISHILNEQNSDLEINVEELLENYSNIFTALINEEDGETYFTITDEAREYFANNQ